MRRQTARGCQAGAGCDTAGSWRARSLMNPAFFSHVAWCNYGGIRATSRGMTGDGPCCNRNSCLLGLPASTCPGLDWGNDSDHRPYCGTWANAPCPRLWALSSNSPSCLSSFLVVLLLPNTHRPNQPLLPALSGRRTRVEEPGTNGRRQPHPNHQPCGAERNAVQPCNRLFSSCNCNSLKDDASPYLHSTTCLLLRYLRTSCKILPGLKDVSLLFRVVGLVVSGSIYRLEDHARAFCLRLWFLQLDAPPSA